MPLLLRDVKTIHLVRDPRGLYASRLQYGTPKSAFNSVEELCRNHAKNLAFLKQLSALPFMRDVIRDNYRLVRYEVISYDTVTMSRKLYDFSGIPLTDDALEKIIRLASNDSTFSISEHKLSAASSANGGGDRNHDNQVASDKSKAIATKWRHRITTAEIRRVEQACAPVMRQLGYVTLDDDDQYANDDIDLIAPITSTLIPTFQ